MLKMTRSLLFIIAMFISVLGLTLCRPPQRVLVLKKSIEPASSLLHTSSKNDSSDVMFISPLQTTGLSSPTNNERLRSRRSAKKFVFKLCVAKTKDQKKCLRFKKFGMWHQLGGN